MVLLSFLGFDLLHTTTLFSLSFLTHFFNFFSFFFSLLPLNLHNNSRTGLKKKSCYRMCLFFFYTVWSALTAYLSLRFLISRNKSSPQLLWRSKNIFKMVAWGWRWGKKKKTKVEWRTKEEWSARNRGSGMTERGV